MNGAGAGPTGSGAVVRDATLADVPGLERCLPRPAHGQRIRNADGTTSRYLVVEANGEVVGFGRLVLAQPAGRARLPYLPKIINLNVRADMRSRGFGRLLIGAMERMARSAGCRVLHIGVNRDNLQAESLYRRLGYEPVGDPPADEPQTQADAEQMRHAGVIYLRKSLVRPEGASPP